MWLNIAWFDSSGTLLREDGAYGDITVQIDGAPTTVRSLLDLDGANTRIYQAHYGMTQTWAEQLLNLGYPSDLILDYDRIDGRAMMTLGDLAAMPAGSSAETFHFALNNTVLMDNRIPPYGMNYDEAERRNASPVPQQSYGGVPGGEYDYYDELALNPPFGASSATIKLLYQPTSWEYIQFLYLANDGSSSFLGNEGANMLEAWLNTGMAEPFVMASGTWQGTGPDCSGANVLLENTVLEGIVSCTATSSLTAQNGVLVKTGSTVEFISPSITLGPGFSVEAGATFTATLAQ
jgi:hypothetical protein